MLSKAEFKNVRRGIAIGLAILIISGILINAPYAMYEYEKRNSPYYKGGRELWRFNSGLSLASSISNQSSELIQVTFFSEEVISIENGRLSTYRSIESPYSGIEYIGGFSAYHDTDEARGTNWLIKYEVVESRAVDGGIKSSIYWEEATPDEMAVFSNVLENELGKVNNLTKLPFDTSEELSPYFEEHFQPFVKEGTVIHSISHTYLSGINLGVKIYTNPDSNTSLVFVTLWPYIEHAIHVEGTAVTIDQQYFQDELEFYYAWVDQPLSGYFDTLVKFLDARVED